MFKELLGNKQTNNQAKITGANIATNAIGADEYISSAFQLCATFVLWLDVINIDSFIYLHIPVIN